MSRALYEVWLDENPSIPKLPWRAQMVNYVGSFRTKEAAEGFAAAVKRIREQKSSSSA